MTVVMKPEKKTELKISVIVMTFNRPEPLRCCLGSLAKQTLPVTMFEIVLVDGSVNPVRDIVAEFSTSLHIRHYPGPNLGVAGNRNRGATLASGRFIAFVDDDCVAWPEWLEKLLLSLEENPEVLIGGAVEKAVFDNACAIAGQAITEAVMAFYHPPGEAPRFVLGLNFAVERVRYLAIGGCDEGFGRLAAEDRDFVDRWRLAGGRIAVCPGAIVRHEHRSTVRGFFLQYFNYGRGAWRYHRLRRIRRSGRMAEDARLHLSLHRYFRKPLMALPPTMKLKVIALFFVWQGANLLGFITQSLIDSRGRWKTAAQPAQ